MKIDRSALMKNAWRIAKILDGYEGANALYHLTDTMKAAWAIALREAATAADGAVEMVQQQAQQQQADASAKPAPVDLSTVEGLRKALVGRTAQLEVQGGEVTYRIVGVDRWTSPDGEKVHDYVKVEDEGMLRDDRKGPRSIHIVRRGSPGASVRRVETTIGEVCYAEGAFCNSNTKKGNARRLVQELLDVEIPEAAPAMVPQQAQQQQANASAKPVPASATGPFDALALKAGYTGTDRTITAASTIYAVQGADGIEDPLIGDLEWLRLLLRNCQNPGAFRALLGGSDDPDATLMMIRCVEDLYRRLATLVGHRTDIYDSERAMQDIE